MSQLQNRLLSFGRYGTPAPPEEFKPYFWMRDSRDPKVRFLWERMVVSTRPDPSDAGMTWFLVTGDEVVVEVQAKDGERRRAAITWSSRLGHEAVPTCRSPLIK